MKQTQTYTTNKQHQQMSSDSDLISSSNDNEFVIFFKVGHTIKKTKLKEKCKSLEELRFLFQSKFQLEDNFSLSDHYLSNRPFTITDAELGISYDLEDINDLYPNCVLEIPERRKSIDAPPKSHELNTNIHSSKLVIIMVGLPARGKSFIAKKIDKYLNWIGVRTKVFNVGQYRRKKFGATKSDFFDPNNEEGRLTRRYLAVAALDDMIEWMLAGGSVGIFDATNTTLDRRQLVHSRCNQENFKVLYVESICEDKSVIERNILETKINSEDYTHFEDEEANEDFRKRLAYYESVYEPITEEELSYVKVINLGAKIIVNNVNTYLSSRIVFFLMHLNLKPKTIYLTRHGQSQFNELGKIGGNSSLTRCGDVYAQRLADFLNDVSPLNGNKDVACWSSTLKRTIETTKYIPRRKIRLKGLDEIDAGEFDGMTYAEIKSEFPEEFSARAEDKLNYRYPRGESYMDVIQRLEQLVFELERQEKDTLIVSHQATLRCLYAYLVGIPVDDVPFLTIPLHTVIVLNPKGYALEENRIELLSLSDMKKITTPGIVKLCVPN
eukprot:TRINITY_DN2667_c0_g1_i1.p1 TRINITY_DN2667_c0_g1~~TRINITY_DN2667_c0_g1_i1.p1  ORF type:complete len:553 (+),score=115.08 TRINITY_DN2667_c0_g1_i1:259-1917(+)